MLPVSPCDPRPAGSGFPSLQFSTGQKSADQLCPLQLGPPLSLCRQGNLFPKAGLVCKWRCWEFRATGWFLVWVPQEHCASGRGRVCSLALGAGLKHHGFFLQKGCMYPGDPTALPENSVVFIKDNGSTKDLFTASVKGKKRGNSSDCRDEILQLI